MKRLKTKPFHESKLIEYTELTVFKEKNELPGGWWVRKGNTVRN